MFSTFTNDISLECVVSSVSPLCFGIYIVSQLVDLRV